MFVFFGILTLYTLTEYEFIYYNLFNMVQYAIYVLNPVTKLMTYVKGFNDAMQAPTRIGNAANDGFEYTSRMVGACVGTGGVAIGAADAAEAIVCADGVCFVISCVGVAADSLQIAASFVSGPNVTALVTTPVSFGCKVFVRACKGKRLPWGGC